MIVDKAEMIRIEKCLYEEGLTEKTLMMRAAKGLFELIRPMKKDVLLLLGKGNNGGDALFCGQLLLKEKIPVKALTLFDPEVCSPLFQEGLSGFLSLGGEVIRIHAPNDLPVKETDVVVDALFGTGFKGEVREPLASIIERVNESSACIVSVDIPSGLSADTGQVEGVSIKASITAALFFPKIGYFLRSGPDVSGRISLIPLEEQIVPKTKYHTLSPPPLYPIKTTQHKYERGFIAQIAGRGCMPGANLLASLAALKSGAGICHLFYPEEESTSFLCAPMECVKKSFSMDCIEALAPLLEKVDVIVCGTGFGLDPENLKILSFLQTVKKPLVLDGDALTLYSKNKHLIPKGAILTPHLKECARLLGHEEKPVVSKEFLEECLKFSKEREVFLVLKGAITFLINQGEDVSVFYEGCPGMATAGSGDLLAGMIGAMRAHLPSDEASSLAVFLHGAAGRLAEGDVTSYSMTASDILKNIPKAFKEALINASGPLFRPFLRKSFIV